MSVPRAFFAALLCAASLSAQAGQSFTYAPTPVFAGTPTVFTDTSTTGGVVANLWQLDGQYYGGGCGCRTLNQTHTFATNGWKTASLILIYGNGTSTTVSQSIYVDLPITANANAPLSTGCAPANLPFNGSGSYTPNGGALNYSWAFSDGGTANGQYVSHTFATGGAHWADLTITDFTGASDTDRVNVTVGQPTASYSIVGPSTVCIGATLQVALTVGGTPPFTAYWSDGVVQTLTSAGTHYRFKQATSAGTVNLAPTSVYDATPCYATTITGSAVFTVQPAATGALSGDDLVSHGEVGELKVALTGTPPFTVTWADGLVQTAAGFELVRRVNPATTTTYAVQSLSDAAACGATVSPSSLTLTVLSAIPAAGRAYTVNGTGLQLRRVRLADGVTEATLPLSVTGFAAVNARSLVRRPGTHDYYVLVTGGGTAAIALLDETTGVGALLGTYALPLREIGFDKLGRLVATEQASGAGFFAPPKHLIDLATGAATPTTSGPTPNATLHLAASPNGLTTFALYGTTTPDGKTFVDYDGFIAPFGNPGPLHYRAGEFTGTIDALSYANGYDFVATLGADYYAVFGASRSVVKLGTFDHGAAGLACAPDAFLGLPGSGDDLRHRVGVNGVFTAEGRRAAPPGTTLTLRTSSPTGGLAGAVAVLYADVYLDGAEPTLSPFGVPGIHIGFPSGIVLAQFPLPGSGDVDLPLGVPPGLAGIVARTQPIVFDPSAKNGAFAVGEACETVFVP
jgi:hypothetical protein